MEENLLKAIVSQFAITGTVERIKPLGEGLINDTYKVITAEATEPDYVLQRVNHHVFPDVDMVMRNIEAVTTHIRKKLEAAGEEDIERKVLRFIPRTSPNPSNGGEQKSPLYLKVSPSIEGQGEDAYWRLMVFIPNAITKQTVDPESSRDAGRAFGRFQAMLADIPVQLGETIKDFHNMEFRLQQLREVVSKDPVGRVSEPKVQRLLLEIDARAYEMTKAERMGREGILPKRVCHCDTKVNNMMFNDKNEVLCVIDLDTVMPNFIFSD